MGAVSQARYSCEARHLCESFVTSNYPFDYIDRTDMNPIMSENEIELKLRLDPADLERFRRDSLIHRAKSGRAVSKRLLAVYYDTANLDLKSRKMAFRIRQEGSERVQTVKGAAGGAGLQRRLEFNATTTAHHPDLALIADEALRGEIAALTEKSPFVPVFTTDIRRTAWMLDLDGGAVELALDVGRIESEGRSVDVCEAELELKGGTPQALLDFALALSERYSCHVGEESKAARGYALFQQSEPKPRKAEKLVLNAKDSAWSSLGRIVEEGTAQVLGNESVILAAKDIEGIHQGRVAIRRIRAALSAFRPVLPDEIRSPLNKELRRQQLALGVARDWDVFLDETLRPLSRREDAPKALLGFMDRAEAARARGYKRAHKVLRSPRYGRLQLALVRFPYLSEPDGVNGLSTGEVARQLLDERFQAVLQAAGNEPTALPEEALHALRIDIKKFRYAIEFFESLYPSKTVKPWRSASKKLQECLGGLNDAVVHAGLVDAMDAPDRPVPKSVRCYIAGHNREKVVAGLAVLDEKWRAFCALSPFWCRAG